ncbi:hypothetical protein JW868_02980 [Candidatus Woesearchaeota archaeon]|nr:hypothetical protein [Candidatus Woesearchaeota archaeon]
MADKAEAAPARPYQASHVELDYHVKPDAEPNYQELGKKVDDEIRKLLSKGKFKGKKIVIRPIYGNPLPLDEKHIDDIVEAVHANPIKVPDKKSTKEGEKKGTKELYHHFQGISYEIDTDKDITSQVMKFLYELGKKVTKEKKPFQVQYLMVYDANHLEEAESPYGEASIDGKKWKMYKFKGAEGQPTEETQKAHREKLAAIVGLKPKGLKAEAPKEAGDEKKKAA